MAEMQSQHDDWDSWDGSELSEQADGTEDESPRKRLKRGRTESQFDMVTIMRSMASNKSKPPRLVVHHIVRCQGKVENGHDHTGHPPSATYLDIPRMFVKDSRAAVLRGQEQVFDVNTYMHQNDDVCMIVCKQYSCQDYHQSIHSDFVKYPVPAWMRSMGPYDTRPWFYFLLSDAELAEPYSEYITVCSDVLRNALEKLDELIPQADADGQLLTSLAAPYNYVYHQRATLHTMVDSLSLAEGELFKIMLNYFDSSQKADFEEADELFSRGKVNAKHFGRLFKRNDIVVREEQGELRAYQVDLVEYAGINYRYANLSCWTWEFDGQFYKTKSEQFVDKPPDDEEISISDLGIWPLRHSSAKSRERLENRGKMFWSLRGKKLISYEAPITEDFEIRTNNPKYMVDMVAYRDMNPEQASSPDPGRESLESSLMVSDEPPDDPFVLLLPVRIKGFGFHDKKWRNLRMTNMRPGDSWNTKAFERLVLEPSKKELIQALVTVHLKTMTPSDVIDDKGAGLIMLLHGPPGTGKTLTAETVAELAGKPLYRITCGDMGTEPGRVEKYLESSLYVGTMWGCVVLLDEADVFLEARTQTDLVRNALVSVFLRVLEYYDGILILTSNRVGTFDEAFTSRMQLAVHYPTLGKSERTMIWRNFIEALEEAQVPINKDKIRWEIDRLADQVLNGRQIRNTIKTARQLAAHKQDTVLQVSHLDHVIKIANEFEKYIVDTRGHTDDQFARDARLRA